MDPRSPQLLASGHTIPQMPQSHSSCWYRFPCTQQHINMHRVDLSWANTTQYLTQAHLPAQITVVTSFLPRRYTHTCSLSTDLQILYPLHQLAETSWSLWKSLLGPFGSHLLRLPYSQRHTSFPGLSISSPPSLAWYLHSHLVQLLASQTHITPDLQRSCWYLVLLTPVSSVDNFADLQAL